MKAACELEITGLKPGSVQIEIEAPTLLEAAPSRFQPGTQLLLFGEPDRQIDGQRSAVDYFGQILAEALAENQTEISADRAMLDTLVRFVKVSGSPYEGVRLDGISGQTRPFLVRPEQAGQLEKLRDDIPPPQAVRVSGLLDMITATKPDFYLRLADGSTVPARLGEANADLLKELFNQEVVISGMAQFRASGKLLAVDVESIHLASKSDNMWQSSPRPLPTRAAARLLRVAQDDGGGVGVFFGTWPGDESDEELLDSLRGIE